VRLRAVGSSSDSQFFFCNRFDRIATRSSDASRAAPPKEDVAVHGV
jgi:hypothetical protein